MSVVATPAYVEFFRTLAPDRSDVIPDAYYRFKRDQPREYVVCSTTDLVEEYDYDGHSIIWIQYR